MCLGGAALGALGLVGWIAEGSFLTTFVPGRPPMMANTALALVLAGVAAALRHPECTGDLRRGLALMFAIVVLLIGVSTLAEYALHVDLHIDRLILRSEVEPYPGRPSPPTATALAFLAAAILLFDTRPTARARPSEWFALLAGLVAFVALLGLLFGAGPLYTVTRTPVVGVALPTALGLLLIAAGLLLERPDAGLMRVATSKGPGSMQFRRLSLLAILGPVLLGLAFARFLPHVDVANFPLVFAVLTAAIAVTSLCLLTITAVPLNRTHEGLESSRARTRALIEQAADGIFMADLDGRYTDVNAAGCRMLGYALEEIVGKTIVDLLPAGDAERFMRHRQQLLEGWTEVSEWTIRRSDGTWLPVEVSAKILPDGRWQAFVRDISGRKRTEARLRQTQERFELALKGADLGSWDWNIQTGEVIFNQRWAEMRGFRHEEVRPLVDSWTAGVHPDDMPRVQKVLDECFRGTIGDYETEHRVATKAGDWIWILDRGRVFARDEHGQPTRMVGTELDITERKRTETALRLSEAKSSGILSISADAIISIDDSQRITMFNEGAEKIFGYSKAEVVGAPLDILIPERFRVAHRQYVESFAASADVSRRMRERTAPISGPRKDGQEFPADAAISKLDVGGTRLLTVALRDITEQKRIESEHRFLAEVGSVLAASLEYEDTVISVARLAVRSLADLCMVDIADEDGHVRRKVASRDPSMAWLCDLLMQTPIEQLAVEDGRPMLRQGLSPEMVAAFSRNEAHLRALRAIEPRSVIAVPLAARGKPLGMIVLVSSTPSRVYGPADVHLAEQLAYRAALSIENARLYRVAQRAIQARDEILGIVAHDLRNPLGTILMQVAMLQFRGGEPADGFPKAAEVIERSATRMNRLIQDLLDVTRIEAGQLSIERARVSAEQVVADAVETQKLLAASGSLELRLELAQHLPEVWADHDRLLQAFENLIGNAVKFTGPGGRITVGAAPRDGEVLFWVTDTGSGIAESDMPHLFDRFWQARNAERRGAGLGLPIVKGIVEAHDGHIWVESTRGSGSTFFFTLPAKRRAEESRPESAAHGSLPSSEVVTRSRADRQVAAFIPRVDVLRDGVVRPPIRAWDRRPGRSPW